MFVFTYIKKTLCYNTIKKISHNIIWKTILKKIQID